MEIKNPPDDINISQPGYPPQQPVSKSSLPLIAGIFLVIAGIIGLIFWIQILTVDWSTIGSLIDISQFNSQYRCLQCIQPVIMSKILMVIFIFRISPLVPEHPYL